MWDEVLSYLVSFQSQAFNAFWRVLDFCFWRGGGGGLHAISLLCDKVSNLFPFYVPYALLWHQFSTIKTILSGLRSLISVPEIRIWSILIIKSYFKWRIHLSRSHFLYYMVYLSILQSCHLSFRQTWSLWQSLWNWTIIETMFCFKF